MTVTTTTMTPADARALRTAADTDAKLLSRKPKYELAAIERHEAGRPAGETNGHWSKDELVSAILARRGFGAARINEATHVLGHEGQRWPACPFCACQVTWTDGDGFLRQCDQPPHDEPMHRDGQAFHSSYAA